MKKILFSDRYCLTDKVLKRQKTVTRRGIKCPRSFNGVEVRGFHVYRNEHTGVWFSALFDEDERDIDDSALVPPYQIGEVVAVAQRYGDIWPDLSAEEVDMEEHQMPDKSLVPFNFEGVNNKMFVRAALMPHQIKIVDIRPERLHEITDDDCIAEGITPVKQEGSEHLRGYIPDKKLGDYGDAFSSVRDAYKELINRLVDKHYWDENPWVWRIKFELVK